ncbi:hypothetical protein [Aestuariispira insulae]|nr:hypothetical protein [Aestuariispira insulae]
MDIQTQLWIEDAAAVLRELEKRLGEAEPSSTAGLANAARRLLRSVPTEANVSLVGPGLFDKQQFEMVLPSTD